MTCSHAASDISSRGARSGHKLFRNSEIVVLSCFGSLCCWLPSFLAHGVAHWPVTRSARAEEFNIRCQRLLAGLQHAQLR